MKRIAVLIPVYNCEQFVAESIQSVLDQTYQEFTVFVVDDCSSDETIAAVKALNDPRIQLIARDQNSGIVDYAESRIRCHRRGVRLHRADGWRRHLFTATV